MGKLSCNCLNVQLYTKNSDLKKSTNALTGLDHVIAHKYFTSGVFEIVLNLEGVRVEHKCLVKERVHTDWRSYHCINCRLCTHCISNQGRVLANATLKHDERVIDELRSGPHFSPLYRIVLTGACDNRPVRGLGVKSEQYESLQVVLTSIQQQLNKFLLDEEAAMERRIKEHEKAQRAAYAAIQSKVRRDKNTMINTILAAEQQDMEETESSPETETPVTVSSQEPEQRVPSMEQRTMNHQNHGSEGSVVHRVPVTHSTDSTPLKPITSQSPPSNMDGVFDFDSAFDDSHTEPFYHSDDNEDTDDSSVTDDRDGSRAFSSSVPISVAWPRSHHQPTLLYEHNEHDDQDSAPAPDNMAASIKALAQSVHGDGTEIFGDLPTRRTRARIGSDLGQL